MAEVELKNITKVYDGKNRVVSNVSFTVSDKEFVVLVGPSGCGKSTTLRMIAGLEEISEGEIFIDGKLVNPISPKDRDIAMVFQNYALYPHMTVYENMAFGLKLRKYPKAEIVSRVEHAAKILEIEGLLQRKPKALSGGQRQRVAVGRAIVRQPKVFLFDEPLSNLDAKLRVQMRTEISKLHHRLEATMIYVTHDQTEAMTMGDRIVVMKDGIIQQIDSPLNLYNYPVNKFVAGFIGSPSMNFIDGTIIHQNSLAFRDTAGTLTIGLAGEAAAKLEKYTDRKITIGIRPEDIYDTPSEEKGKMVKADVKLEVVEPMGNEIFLYFTVADSPVIARIPAREKPVQGSMAAVYFNSSKLHFFDHETGLAIV